MDQDNSWTNSMRYVTRPVIDLASRRACHVTDWTVGSAPDQSKKMNTQIFPVMWDPFIWVRGF